MAKDKQKPLKLKLKLLPLKDQCSGNVGYLSGISPLAYRAGMQIRAFGSHSQTRSMGGAARIVFLIYFNFLLIKFGLNDLVQTTVVTIPRWCATLIP